MRNIPVAALLNGICTFRAHLSTAFHSGRTEDTSHRDQVKPIARETTAELSGVGRSSQRRINRELKDLVMKGMPGNVGGTSEPQKPEKIYYPNGKLAAKAYGRDPERELHWKRHRTGNGRFEVWQQMGGG